ncbi:hypothetical protein VPH35_006119 [Triticum aestivum]
MPEVESRSDTAPHQGHRRAVVMAASSATPCAHAHEWGVPPRFGQARPSPPPSSKRPWWPPLAASARPRRVQTTLPARQGSAQRLETSRNEPTSLRGGAGAPSAAAHAHGRPSLNRCCYSAVLASIHGIGGVNFIT